jgi:hypothetical protein
MLCYSYLCNMKYVICDFCYLWNMCSCSEQTDEWFRGREFIRGYWRMTSEEREIEFVIPLTNIKLIIVCFVYTSVFCDQGCAKFRFVFRKFRKFRYFWVSNFEFRKLRKISRFFETSLKQALTQIFSLSEKNEKFLTSGDIKLQIFPCRGKKYAYFSFREWKN